MKAKLEIEVDNKDILNEWFDDDEEVKKEKIREYLMQNLFEICEDWVLYGQEPHIDFEDEPKLLVKTK